MTARAEASEADVGKIYPGMPVYFTTLGDTRTRYYSTVRQVLPTPNIVNDVVLYQVLTDVENTTGKLMDSMTTQLFFSAKQTRRVAHSACRRQRAAWKAVCYDCHRTGTAAT